MKKQHLLTPLLLGLTMGAHAQSPIVSPDFDVTPATQNATRFTNPNIIYNPVNPDYFSLSFDVDSVAFSQGYNLSQSYKGYASLNIADPQQIQQSYITAPGIGGGYEHPGPNALLYHTLPNAPYSIFTDYRNSNKIVAGTTRKMKLYQPEYTTTFFERGGWISNYLTTHVLPAANWYSAAGKASTDEVFVASHISNRGSSCDGYGGVTFSTIQNFSSASPTVVNTTINNNSSNALYLHPVVKQGPSRTSTNSNTYLSWTQVLGTNPNAQDVYTVQHYFTKLSVVNGVASVGYTTVLPIGNHITSNASYCAYEGYGSPYQVGGVFARVSDYPAFAVDESPINKGRIYYAYPEKVNNVAVIKLRISNNDGTSWQTYSLNGGVISDPTVNAWSPAVAVDPTTGFVTVAYQSGSNSAVHTYVAYSVDGGQTFANQQVSAAARNNNGAASYSGSRGSDFIDVAAINGKAVVAWGDDRSGVYHIRASVVTYQGINGPMNMTNGSTYTQQGVLFNSSTFADWTMKLNSSTACNPSNPACSQPNQTYYQLNYGQFSPFSNVELGTLRATTLHNGNLITIGRKLNLPPMYAQRPGAADPTTAPAPFVVAPNPAADYITITAPQEKGQFRITNLMGQVVKQVEFDGTKATRTVFIGDLTNSVYQCTYTGQPGSQKLIVRH